MESAATQHTRFKKKLTQKVNAVYLGKDTTNIQKDAMLLWELCNERQDHKKVTAAFFNQQCHQTLWQGFWKIPSARDCKEFFPPNLKPQARHKYIKKRGKEVHEEKEIHKLCQFILDILNIEYEISQWQSDKKRNCNKNNVRDPLQNQNWTEDKERGTMCHAKNMMALTSGWTAQTSDKTRAMPVMGTSPCPGTVGSTIRQRGQVIARKDLPIGLTVPPLSAFNLTMISLHCMLCSKNHGNYYARHSTRQSSPNHHHNSAWYKMTKNFMQSTLGLCRIIRGLISWNLATTLGHCTSKDNGRTFTMQQDHS